MATIVDRRLNPSGKSIPNRQRFLGRAKAQVKKAVTDAIKKGKIKDLAEDGGNVEVTSDPGPLDEPSFRKTDGGTKDHVLPGNEQYHKGDKVPRPEKGGGGGACRDGSGNDSFTWNLTREEFLDIFFEDMELPDLEKRQLMDMEQTKPHRAGFTTSGSPSSINVIRTMRRGMARRIALGRPDDEEIARLEMAVVEALSTYDIPLIVAAQQALAEAEEKRRGIPYLEPTTDLRYNRFEHRPQPRTSAVMFCLMDVSGSMTEKHKDIAKRFFMLLYLFLRRKYLKVEIVFISYHSFAQEVDEHTFFYGTDTGGTNVDRGLEEMIRIQAERYPTSDYNVYGAMASDGDAWNDPRILEHMNVIGTFTNYFAYMEIRLVPTDEYGNSWYYMGSATGKSPGALWGLLVPLLGQKWFAMKSVAKHEEVFGVLADLFAKKDGREAIAA